ncbi:hypothetical protein ABPG75_004708 [Micractinium tetrahymenae]
MSAAPCASPEEEAEAAGALAALLGGAVDAGGGIAPAGGSALPAAPTPASEGGMPTPALLPTLGSWLHTPDPHGRHVATQQEHQLDLQTEGHEQGPTRWQLQQEAQRPPPQQPALAAPQWEWPADPARDARLLRRCALEVRQLVAEAQGPGLLGAAQQQAWALRVQLLHALLAARDERGRDERAAAWEAPAWGSRQQVCLPADGSKALALLRQWCAAAEELLSQLRRPQRLTKRQREVWSRLARVLTSVLQGWQAQVAEEARQEGRLPGQQDSAAPSLPELLGYLQRVRGVRDAVAARLLLALVGSGPASPGRVP